MRRFIPTTLALGATLAFATSAAAQPAGPWSGAYVGAFAGDAFGQSSVTNVVACNIFGLLCFSNGVQAASAAFIGQVGSGAASASAFTGGGFAGVNWQNGLAVYGFEADVGSLPLHLAVAGTADSENVGLNNGGSPSVFTISAGASTDWMATARARFGFLPAPGLLLYGTAGLAATELTVANSFSENFQTGITESSSNSEFRTALVIGAGAEWALAPHWRLRAEYLHADFGPVSTTGLTMYQGSPSNAITGTADLTADVVRVAVAYRF